MERTSGGLAPVLAANGQFFCTNFLLHAGTHYLRSTLTDQFLACEAAVLGAAGYTIYSVQRAIVDAGGRLSLDRVYEDSQKPFPKPTETTIPIPPTEWKEETGCEQVIPEWSVEFVAGRIEEKHGYANAPTATKSYWDYGVPWKSLVHPYAMKFPAHPDAHPGRCVRVIDYHWPVGYERDYNTPSNQPQFELTTTYTVVTEADTGYLVTAHPGRPGEE